jgi:hypothetical protein
MAAILNADHHNRNSPAPNPTHAPASVPTDRRFHRDAASVSFHNRNPTAQQPHPTIRANNTHTTVTVTSDP